MSSDFNSCSEFMAAFTGGFVTLVMVLVLLGKCQPEIKPEELYRFCLVKNIPLEQCVIPPKPFKSESPAGGKR